MNIKIPNPQIPDPLLAHTRKLPPIKTRTTTPIKTRTTTPKTRTTTPIRTTTPKTRTPIKTTTLEPLHRHRPISPIKPPIIDRAKKTYIIGPPRTPPRTPPQQTKKRPNSPITPTYTSPPHITNLNEFVKNQNIVDIDENDLGKRYKKAQEYLPDMSDKDWVNQADLHNKQILKSLHRDAYNTAKDSDYNKMLVRHTIGQDPTLKNEQIKNYDYANLAKQEEEDWIFGGKGNRRRSNKKRSYKKRSNKKRSNKKRSNKKRSNKRN